MLRKTVKQRITKARGFTLIELLVVVAIIGVLASLLFPVISRVKSEGRRARCISNLRQISTGWLSYSLDCDAYVPFSDANAVITHHWALKLTPYVGARWSDKLYHCPDYRNTNNLIRPGFFLEQRGSYDINVVGTSRNYQTGRGVGGTIYVGPPGLTPAGGRFKTEVPLHG